MRLKRLVARGFKSFADRTEFEFDSRLTGIIGPNGCGKSNVVDAIKWVLGDQRAKSLRGAEMTDVIFKGAEGRDAMGMAEVTITFEDPQGRLEGRTEIDISRRLTLEKESSYLLNGQEVRLKDVRDVLLDTGLGTGGYSVMEQGRIDAVLSANPEARRAIFEEAAGIARFKLQKKESLRKLERTDQNLARATDLLEERARRIRSLRIQAGKARRWQELQAALRDLRAAIAVLEAQQVRIAGGAALEQLKELEATMATSELQREEAEAAVHDCEAIVGRCAQALEVVRTELHRCRAELAAQQERMQAQQQRAQDLREEAARGRQRGQTLAALRLQQQAQLDAARSELTQKEAALVELAKMLEALRQGLAESQRTLRSCQQERERERARLLELLHERTRARNAAVDQEARIAAARARQARLAERLATVDGEAGTLERERELAAHELGQVHIRERVLQERETSALADLQQADAAAAELAAREAELQRQWSQLDGQHGALLAMEAQHEGFDHGPKHVLSTQPIGLRGRLVDLLDVDLRHGKALEAALGPNVQALVVDTRANAEAILAELQQRRLGRVLLLVEEEFAEAPTGPSLLPLPEGAQSLLDLVRSPHGREASRRLLSWLLRGVVLVDSLAQADAGRCDLCFVTPDGALLCGPRLEGGAVDEGHAGLVVRRSQIQELAGAAAAVAAQIKALSTGKEQAAARVEALKQELRQLTAHLQDARRQAQAQEAQLARAAARHADLVRERGELEREAQDLMTAVCGGFARLGRALVDRLLIERREALHGAREAELGQQVATAEVAVQSAVRDEHDARLQQAQGNEAREGLLRAIAVHEAALRESDAALEELADAVQQNETAAERAQLEAMRLDEAVALMEDAILVQQQQQAAAEYEVESARTAHRQAQLDLQQRDHHRRELQDQAGARRLQLQELEHRFTRLEERLREEVGVELRRCLGDIHGLGIEFVDEEPGPPAPLDAVLVLQGPPLPPLLVAEHYGMARLWLDGAFEPAEARKEVQILQANKDRLGAVNLGAVAELASEEGQLGTLEQEVNDLKEARRALMETLKKLEAESKTLFETTFEQARKNFQEIFRKLFQGGKADMFLGQTEDLLEAGIEIVAQPPGKQLQSINLLSGGERSLTAVAILFALFKVRPSPFCILDEVDAALDETNVERFLRVLRDFTHDTQFCIVTHHKRTMADCQALYGITMQRRGVSSRIAVQLHEVENFQGGGVALAGSGNLAGSGERPDPAAKKRIAGEEQVGF